jgi:hypothetical protein
VYRCSRAICPVVRYPDTIASSVSSNPIRMPYLEAQEVRFKELGYSVGAQPPIRYLPCPRE